MSTSSQYGDPDHPLANDRASFRGADVVVLVPTMNRPGKLTRLLESLVAQTEAVGHVILVDGAENAEGVAREFSSRLPVEYFRCHPPGQLRQRSHGLAQLSRRDRLVALLDDDIVLEPGAVKEMVNFWNAAPPDTAGVCFNIVNEEPERRSTFRLLLGLTGRAPGRVLRSGQTTAVTHASRNTRVQWLPGGATVWRTEVLLDRPHLDVASRWAIGEDLIFSYPIGKRRPLYVCAAARVSHEHVSDYRVRRLERYHGRTQTLWTYHFVASNADLSRFLFIVSLLLRMTGKFFGRGILRRDRESRGFVLGQLSALASIATNALGRRGTVALLEEAGTMNSPANDVREPVP